MEEPDSKKEVQELKNKIFSLYMLCLDESLPDRQKHVGQLWDLILRWNKRWNIDYQIKKSKFGDDLSDMGEEVFNVLRTFLGEARDYIPKNTESFFKYLKTSLSREAARLAREENEVIIPKGKLEKIKKLNQQIEIFISENNKKPTVFDIQNIVRENFKTREDYIGLISLIKIHDLESANFNEDGDKETFNHLDQEEFLSAFNFEGLMIPHLEYDKKHDPTVMERLKSFAEDYLSKIKKDRDCFRAIFTLYCCVDVNCDLDCLRPVLDINILNDYMLEGKKPFQYEIYQKYHNVTKGSAEVGASKMWRKFWDELMEWNKIERIFIPHP